MPSISLELICGINFGFEMALGEWIDAPGTNYVILDLGIFRVLLTFQEK